MSDVIEQPEATPEPVAPPAPVEPPAPVDEDAALDQRLETEAIAVPDGEKLVPLSAVTRIREKYKETRDKAARAEAIAAELEKVKAELDESKPYVEAFKTLEIARQAAPQQVQPQTAPVDPAYQAELVELARDLDLYTPDGQPDLGKAERIYTRQAKVAEQVARRAVQPLQQQTVQQQAGSMYQKALATAAPDGSRPDPAILRDVFSRLDPALVATEDGARQAWMSALGMSAAAGRLVRDQATPAKKADPPPAPLYSEKAGGLDGEARVSLSPSERAYIKEAGITEKDYLEAAAKRPWRR